MKDVNNPILIEGGRSDEYIGIYLFQIIPRDNYKMLIKHQCHALKIIYQKEGYSFEISS